MQARFIPELRRRLIELHRVVSACTNYRFFGSSLLLVYDGAADADPVRGVDVRMIDFANTCKIVVTDGDAASAASTHRHAAQPDTGYLLGLRTLIDMLTAIEIAHCTEAAGGGSGGSSGSSSTGGRAGEGGRAGACLGIHSSDTGAAA